MGQIEMAGRELDVATFREYANSARLLFNSQEIKAVYDALDKLNLSKRSDDDLTQFNDFMKSFTLASKTTKAMVTFAAMFSMTSTMNIAAGRLAASVQTSEIVAAGREPSVFEMLGGFSEFLMGVSRVAAVVDAVLDVMDIVDVVKH
ncbi:hypothetical protein CMUS01_11840 [Colletotrichum musicola]|uniref:Uncharacterized protein n=1 Tax=Colletotrichum musicola TaxID=2175873 RepID=A0A8H6JU98_9PEZI|nr:hypothetical protein CMUS01_11840 [Colletotrichum musicola]